MNETVQFPSIKHINLFCIKYSVNFLNRIYENSKNGTPIRTLSTDLKQVVETETFTLLMNSEQQLFRLYSLSSSAMPHIRSSCGYKSCVFLSITWFAFTRLILNKHEMIFVFLFHRAWWRLGSQNASKNCTRKGVGISFTSGTSYIFRYVCNQREMCAFYCIRPVLLSFVLKVGKISVELFIYKTQIYSDITYRCHEEFSLLKKKHICTD